jgi:uncharacterized protein (TIGR02145 family)
MKTKNRIWILILSIMFIFLSRCKTQEIFLHGDITGKVTDVSTGEPVEAASVKIDPSGDSTITGSDGTYVLRNINPGPYEIQASKFSYALYKKNVTVVSAEPQNIDFPLTGIPKPNPSTLFLDFSLDSTTLSFSISNSAKGKFIYFLIPSQKWITVSRELGEITDETDKITVTINKTGLSESIYKESIKVTSFAGPVSLPDIIIHVYLNGVADRDGNYYKVVTIGTQIWMAENLNSGIQTPLSDFQKDNGIIEKHCYNDLKSYCDIYGGLYQWAEAMQYKPPDNGIIGTTQGICPAGWHMPTISEWQTLSNYLDGPQVAGGKLKEKGFAHWLQPNSGATNESGFSALPGGQSDGTTFNELGIYGLWWSTDMDNLKNPLNYFIYYDSPEINRFSAGFTWSASVRCVKNQGKK